MRKNWTKMRRDRRADIGIGTMIVFIAMVLVAAVAAAVLISTANQVREQATSTGDQAINNVAAGFVKVSVSAKVGASAGVGIDVVNVKVRLAAGSPDVLMTGVILNHIIAGTATPGATFSATASFEVSGDWTFDGHGAAPVVVADRIVHQGDLINIAITGLSAANTGAGCLHALDSMEISIIPAFGQPTYINFMVPEVLVAATVYLVG